VLLDPLRPAQLVDLGAFEAPRGTVIQVFQTRLTDLEAAVFQSERQAAVFFPQALALDQQSQAFLKVQFEDCALLTLLVQGLGHALQAQGEEFFHRLGVEHKLRGVQT